jgi:predicted DCC family thiol-disulfide oxidoreductase YuxK
VVLTADGILLTRSSAVRYTLVRLGGMWRLLSAASTIIPAGVLDRLYDVTARVRHRFFARPSAACPVLPPH